MMSICSDDENITGFMNNHLVIFPLSNDECWMLNISFRKAFALFLLLEWWKLVIGNAPHKSIISNLFDESGCGWFLLCFKMIWRKSNVVLYKVLRHSCMGNLVTFCFLNITFCMDMNLRHKILLDDPVIFAWRWWLFLEVNWLLIMWSRSSCWSNRKS